jgi:hypothetical protein
MLYVPLVHAFGGARAGVALVWALMLLWIAWDDRFWREL